MKSGAGDRLLGLTSKTGEPRLRISEAPVEKNSANSKLQFVKSTKHLSDTIDTRRFAAKEVTLSIRSPFINVGIEREVPGGKTVHAILDNYAAHKHPRFENGWRAIRAGHSTSRRPRPPGSTPSRASSRPSPSAASSAASSNPWLICRPPSTASSMITTPSQSPSNGSLTPKKSSKPSDEGTKR